MGGFFSGLGAGLAKASKMIQEDDKIELERRRIQDEMLTNALKRRIAQAEEGRSAQLFPETLTKAQNENLWYPKQQQMEQNKGQAYIDEVGARIKEIDQQVKQRTDEAPYKINELKTKDAQNQILMRPDMMEKWGQGQIAQFEQPGIINAMHRAQTQKYERLDQQDVVAQQLQRLQNERNNLVPGSPQDLQKLDEMNMLLHGNRAGNRPESKAQLEAQLLRDFYEGKTTSAQNEMLVKMGVLDNGPRGPDPDKQRQLQAREMDSSMFAYENHVRDAITSAFKSQKASFTVMELEKAVADTLARDPRYQSLKKMRDIITAETISKALPNNPSAADKGFNPDAGEVTGPVTQDPLGNFSLADKIRMLQNNPTLNFDRPVAPGPRKNPGFSGSFLPFRGGY